MYSAAAVHYSYEDSGIFCIQASAHPSMVSVQLYSASQKKENP